MERIREHILTQAREEAEAIVREAREEADRRLKAARERIQRDLDARLAHAQAQLEREHQQALDRQAFEHRLEVLRRKRAILDQVFEAAKSRFAETPGYRDWLARRLGGVESLAGEVLCRDRDHEVCRRALERLGHEDRGGLRLAETGAADAARVEAGGVVVRTENFDLDLTLTAAFDDLRGRVMPELIAVAFSGLEDASGDLTQSGGAGGGA
jgi:vacuolar-type H+-ATPase subunit E/Vma4